MNVIEAARRLAAAVFTRIPREYGEDVGPQCVGCDEIDYATGIKHAADCPVPMLPQIVAALEQGERLQAAVQVWVDAREALFDHAWTDEATDSSVKRLRYVVQGAEHLIRAALHGQEPSADA